MRAYFERDASNTKFWYLVYDSGLVVEFERIRCEWYCVGSFCPGIERIRRIASVSTEIHDAQTIRELASAYEAFKTEVPQCM